jgi:predicted TIM-barrel fold metal-dependent hydrolase
MAPYWALAAKYDVPVAVHINRGPAPASGLRGPAFNAEMGNPALLGPVLERHRGLRVLLQHVGTGGPRANHRAPPRRVTSRVSCAARRPAREALTAYLLGHDLRP